MSTIELTAIFVSEFRPKDCGDFAIATFRLFDEATEAYGETFKAVGNWNEGELKPHQTYRLYGRWQEKPPYGKQFAITTFIQSRPFGRVGVTKYLEQAPGIGAARATQIWNLFGSDAIRICRQHPELLVEKVKGVSLDAAKAIAAKLDEMKSLEGVSIDMIELCSSHNIPKTVVREAVKKYGNRAPDLIRKNPYLLLQFRGVGFLKADSVYCGLGLRQDRIKRQINCLSHEAKDSEDTWLSESAAKTLLQKKIAGASIALDRTVAVGKRAKRFSTKRHCSKCGGQGRAMVPDLFFGETLVDGPCPNCQGTGGPRWISLYQRAENERVIAEKVAALLRTNPDWPDPARIKGISDHQGGGLFRAFRSSIGCFIGGPGTGKSYTVAALTAALLEKFGEFNVAAASPTNKAAVRLTEGFRANDIGLKATSIHSLLGVESVADGNWTFKHNRHNPLPYRVLLLDEQSMLSCDLGACLFDAILPGTLVLLIGDTGQLPPIQHGAVLRDLLAAGVPTGELTEPQRNAGDLVFACQDIRLGKRFRESEEIDIATKPPRNFKFISARSPDAQIEELFKLLEWAKSNGIDPVWDCQIMSAVNRNSKVSRDEINKLMQAHFNSSIGGSYRPNDKVICDENGMYPASADGSDVFIAKGELGRILTVGKKEMSIRFDGEGRTVNMPVGKELRSSKPGDGGTIEVGCPVSLAYSCTVHRMQGSETKLAIPMIDESAGAKWLGCRELFFTAISRGKLLTRPIGNRNTADQMCKKVSIGKRKTFLAELVKEHAKGALKPAAPLSMPPPALTPVDCPIIQEAVTT